MSRELSRVSQLVRPNIRELEPYHCAREKVQKGILLDANENPFQHLVDGTIVNRYPDPYQRQLRAALAEYLEVKPENVLAGSGSDEVLDWIFKVFCQPGTDAVATAEPTYGMYRVMADIYGVELQEFRLDAEFDFDHEDFLHRVDPAVKVLFLCTPNNPTGNLLSRRRIVDLLERWDRMVVVDEAYFEFSSGETLVSEVERFPHLMVMRTFSKAFGCAGIRLGYVVGHSEVVEHFRKVKAPYNLNALTLELGVEALTDLKGTRGQINEILDERNRLDARLRRIPGIEQVYDSEANFILFRVPQASRICRQLIAEGIVVRDRSSLPGLMDCIRVSVGTPEENRLFLNRLEETVKGLKNE